MNKQTEAITNYLGQLTEDAQALMAATAGVAEEKVEEARRRLASALDRGRQIYGVVRDKEMEGVRVADGAVREHPYEAIAIGVAAGAFIGFLFSHACSRHDPQNHCSRR